MTTIDQLRLCVTECPTPLQSEFHDLFVFTIILWSIDFRRQQLHFPSGILLLLWGGGTQRDEFLSITKVAKRNKNYTAYDQSIHTPYSLAVPYKK